MKEKDKRRFWSKVKKTRSCWVWTGANDGKYGVFVYEGKWWKAHRLSYLMANRFLSIFDLVMHKCDNPACVRPAHLFVGSASDNMTDCAMKGRLSVQKLSPEMVRSIRRRCARGESQVMVADSYNLSRSAVSLIVRRKRWRKVK